MNEIGKYGVLKEKLQGICEENNLTYHINNKGYPFLLTIKPLGGMEAQQSMIEGMDEAVDTGYISPDASLVFAYRDGDLTYKISETFTISDKLFNKLKGLFKKMHDMWMQYFYRDVYEHSPGMAPENRYTGPQEGSVSAEGEDETDPFADFMADAAPAEIDEETENDALEDTEGEE